MLDEFYSKASDENKKKAVQVLDKLMTFWLIRPLTTLDEDRKRHIPEIAVLEEKHGKELVESTLTKVSNISYQYPIIPRHILLYWACDFVDRKHSQLREFAIPMSKVMLQNQQIDKFTQILNMVQKEYGSRIPFDCFANILKGVIGAKHT